MIGVNEVAKIIEGMLNESGEGIYSFKLFEDTGEIIGEKGEADYTGNKIVGLVEFLPSTIIGEGFKYLNLQTKTTIYIDGTGIKQKELNDRTNKIKDVINRVISRYNKKANAYIFGGLQYQATISMGLPQNLECVSIGYMRKALPVELYWGWNILINGVMSSDIKFYIDGENFIAQNWNIDRVRTCESNAKDGLNNTRAYEKVNGLNVTLNGPFLAGKLGEEMYKDIMNGDLNKAHLLVIENQTMNNYKDFYITIFGNNGLAGIDGVNVGNKVSIIEGDEDLLEYKEGIWNRVEKVVGAGEEVVFEFTEGTDTFIFWGDGEKTYGNNGIYTHTYQEAGTYNIIVCMPFYYDMLTVKYYLDNELYTQEFIVSGNLAEDIEIPDEAGYEIRKWYTDSNLNNKFDFNTPVTGNLELYAKKEEIVYTIDYMWVLGEPKPSETYTISSSPITLTPPPSEVAGYTFEGWYRETLYINKVEVIYPDRELEDITLVAKYNLIEYSITYNLDGGINGDNPSTFNVESDTIVLKDATKENYIFEGWYAEPEFINKVETIFRGSVTENIQLYAKFLPKEITPVYDLREDFELTIERTYSANPNAPLGEIGIDEPIYYNDTLYITNNYIGGKENEGIGYYVNGEEYFRYCNIKVKDELIINNQYYITYGLIKERIYPEYGTSDRITYTNIENNIIVPDYVEGETIKVTGGFSYNSKYKETGEDYPNTIEETYEVKVDSSGYGEYTSKNLAVYGFIAIFRFDTTTRGLINVNITCENSDVRITNNMVHDQISLYRKIKN